MIKKLFIDKSGINYIIRSDFIEMHTLYAILEEVVFINELQQEISNDLKEEKKLEYLFPSTSIKIIDSENCILLDLFRNDVSGNLKISMNALWKAIEDYDKLKNQAYKKMTISFDGEKVYFDLEK